MLLIRGGLGLVLLGFWVFCIIDVIVTDEHRIRHLPKITWLFVVVLLPTIGSIAWLVAGRPSGSHVVRRDRMAREFPEYDRPGRQVAVDPAADEEFLRGLRARAEQQRQKAAAERRARELEEQ